MTNQEFVQKLGFLPKDKASEIFYKKFASSDYVVEVDFEAKKFNFGTKIKAESGTTLNFSQEENWVVFECVCRLLEKGYKPEDIILEKTFPSGHGHSGRLDIFIKKEGQAFLMIECKTFGKEFEKELKNIAKDGGQLFTYFQNNTNTQYLMLYTSQLKEGELEFKTEIIKIEDNYRTAGNVADFYGRWNKLTIQNGIFEDWVKPYHFENKLLTKKELLPLNEADSGFIFHEFLSILRKHSVSDKPNAFNKIFNLFLAKIYDEKKREGDELDFQWKEKRDNPVDFQIRLINLYKDGMLEFLRKEIEGIDDKDFSYKTTEELQEKKKKWLKFNNVFTIKEVVDDESFDDNQRVLKEVVELLQRYQIRYPRRQQHLSDFFERLLTTGLKQESGQFFTPPPITRFIIKSLPVKQMIEKELNQPVSKLPAVIDYAAGSGHFITEIMEQYQDIINKIDPATYYPEAIKTVEAWKVNPYAWAARYVFGVEKDYRLVKVAKVGCYFYGDGLAQIMHGDGLDNFKSSKSFVGLLKENVDDPQKAKFSFVISNPPYSVSAFKADIKNNNAAEDFALFKNLTDNSSEIECLFIERAKQLLKVGGIAALVLPSSMLSNTGIYTKTREIIFENFEIIAIVELGSNTFMATGTNTVTLFLRRKDNANNANLKIDVAEFFTNLREVTLAGIEKPVSKFIKHVWEGISFADYLTLAQKKPNETILKHEIFVEYKKKIKAKDEREFWEIVREKEIEKIFYFIMTYKQKVVLVKSGEKEAEKRFLGYEFSNRRGSEGIHPIQRGKTIDQCTQLFDVEVFDNPKKASTYILKALEGDFDCPIDESLQENISRHDLIDMLSFDRIDFEKTISLNVKKKIKIESNWEIVRLGDVASIKNGFAFKSQEYVDNGLSVIRIKNVQKGFINNSSPVFIAEDRSDEFNNFILKSGDILISMTGNPGRVGIAKNEHLPALLNQRVGKVEIVSSEVLKDFLFVILNTEYFENKAVFLAKGLAQQNISTEQLESIEIPLPPKDVQEKIVAEIEKIEKNEKKNKREIESLKKSISKLLPKNKNLEKLENIATLLKRGKSPKYGDSSVQIIKSGQARGFREFDFSQKHFVSNAFVLDERKLEMGDILINSTGVGTAGRVTMFNLEGNYVADSHITILRLDQEKALPDYILYCLCGLGFKTIEAMALGQSGQIELSLETIKNIKLPLLTLDEQQIIVAQIFEIENQISVLECELREAGNRKKAVLKKYL
ncbi:MAG: restriction endonuclease subunit S [Candidatus Moraniibacteriota bacterium]